MQHAPVQEGLSLLQQQEDCTLAPPKPHTTSKAAAFGKHQQFLLRSLQFLGLGAGLLTPSMEQPLQGADAKCVCPTITHGVSPIRFCCWAATARIDSLQHLLASECMTSFVAARGEHNIGRDAAWWSSAGEASHVVPVRVPLSLIAPFSAH